MNDFKPGWSDIDLLCLTAETTTDEQARKLVNLGQTLSFYEKQPIYFQYFEGAIVAWPAFKSRSCTKVVYWGTGKQRIDHSYFVRSLFRIFPDTKRYITVWRRYPGRAVPAVLYCAATGCHKSLRYNTELCAQHKRQRLCLRMASGYRAGHLYIAHWKRHCKNQSGRMGAETASVPGGTRPKNSADCQEQPAAL